MAVKKNDRGSIIGNVDFITVRQLGTYAGHGKNRKMTTSTIALLVGKKNLIERFQLKL